MKRLSFLIISIFYLANVWGQTKTNKIESTGYVGIGTTDPQQKLQVEDGAIGVGDQSAGNWMQIKQITTDGYGYNFQHNNASVIINEQGGTNQAIILGDVDNNNNSVLFGVSHLQGGPWTPKLTLTGNGNLGIGTTNPFQKLTVKDGQLFFGHSLSNQFESGRIRFVEYASNSYLGAFIHYDGNHNVMNLGVHNIHDLNMSNDINAISIKRENGYVGIGTTNPQAKLAVAGTILAKEVRVSTDQNDWPDFVFEEDYHLKDLSEVENYIKEHKHLEGIASAKEMEEQGVNLAEMNKLLLQKIEELTLHTIAQEKKLKEKDIEVESLEERLAKIEALLIKGNDK